MGLLVTRALSEGIREYTIPDIAVAEPGPRDRPLPNRLPLEDGASGAGTTFVPMVMVAGGDVSSMTETGGTEFVGGPMAVVVPDSGEACDVPLAVRTTPKDRVSPPASMRFDEDA